MLNIFRPTGKKRVLFFISSDIILSVFTIFLAYLLRFKFHIPNEFYESIIKTIFVLIPIKISILAIFKQYSITWRFYSLVEAKNLFKA